jgi:hypothetical protein
MPPPPWSQSFTRTQRLSLVRAEGNRLRPFAGDAKGHSADETSLETRLERVIAGGCAIRQLVDRAITNGRAEERRRKWRTGFGRVLIRCKKAS